MSPDYIKKTAKEKEAFWEGIFEREASYPGSIKEFCEKENINLATFYWRKKMATGGRGRPRKKEALPKEKKKFDPAPFVKVQFKKEAPAILKQNLPEPTWLAQFLLALLRQEP